MLSALFALLSLCVALAICVWLGTLLLSVIGAIVFFLWEFCARAWHSFTGTYDGVIGAKLGDK